MAVAGAIVLGLIGLGSVANATEPHFGNIDPDATGSITVHKHETGSQTPDGTPDGKTAVNGTPVAGVTFTFFQLVNLDMTTQAGWEGWDSFTVPADACGDGNSPNLTLPNGDSGVFILRGDEVTKAMAPPPWTTCRWPSTWCARPTRPPASFTRPPPPW